MLKIIAFILGLALAAATFHQQKPVKPRGFDPPPCSPTKPHCNQ